jgi:CheY-like chemotaxis protein
MNTLRPTVLVADDNRFNRAIVAHLLAQLGHPCLEADSGEDALAVLARERVAMVLMDLQMPGLRGEVVCARIRAQPALAGLKVIAFTAHRMAHEARALLASGFDDALIKPPTLHDIRQMCERHLGNPQPA